jgi:ketosteroid isomerase-like protein
MQLTPRTVSEQTMSSPEVSVVTAWHETLNAGDIDRLIALSTDDVEVGGPRGSSRGAQLLREWVGRAGIHLWPRQLLQRGETVVVEQDAEWRSAETDEITGRQTPASVFVVRDGRVASVIRYPDLATALAVTGLTDADRA